MTMGPVLPRLALALLLIAIAIGAALHRDQIAAAILSSGIGALGVWGAIGYVALYVLAVVAFVPGAIFGLAGGALFGPLLGSVLNLSGATLGTVIDVREPEEFTGALGHLLTARNLPLPEPEHRIADLTGLEGTPLVLVCRTDKCSPKAAKLIREAGFRNVSVLHGGMERWNEDKLPIENRKF
jgi:rhodanese-related sulfurtransferase